LAAGGEKLAHTNNKEEWKGVKLAHITTTTKKTKREEGDSEADEIQIG
jgi:hypothetical protein